MKTYIQVTLYQLAIVFRNTFVTNTHVTIANDKRRHDFEIEKEQLYGKV